MAATPATEFIVQSAQGPYAVTFHEEIAEVTQALRAITGAVLLIDQRVAELYANPLASLTEHFPTLTIEATEEEKTLTGIARLLTFLQERNATKQTTLIAIGGGIIQDIATFTAHIYYRGIPWVFVPTTLLAQCDSCIGAKAGINFSAFKNQLGVFHAPAHVFLYPQFITTLSELDTRSGYGEILKLHLIGSIERYETFRESVVQHGLLHNPDLRDFIRESLMVKRAIIEHDEYEMNERHLLNYGHTFGHALEAITAHEVPHGIAIAWGLDLANALAQALGVLDATLCEDIHRLITQHFACPLSRPITPQALLSAAWRDKKVRDGNLTLILLRKPGDLVITRAPSDDALTPLITRFLTRDHALHRR